MEPYMDENEENIIESEEFESDNISEYDSDHESKIESESDTVKSSDVESDAIETNIEIDVDEIIKLDCKHKNIQCKILTPCCGLIFPCVVCHDDYFTKTQNRHFVNYKEIISIKCSICGMILIINNMCCFCNTQFAPYYCDTCKIFSDDIKLVHCDNCNCCIIDDNEIHKCNNMTLDGFCCICTDALKDGNELKIMTCGHILHNQCYNELIKHSHKCPICSKTIKNMMDEYKKLDEKIKKDPIKKKIIIRIYCYECEKENDIEYHYSGYKCSLCGSYRTCLVWRSILF